MPRPALVLPAVLTAAALVASTAIAGPAGAAPLGRPAVRVYATNTHGAVAPDSVHPGIAHIRNIGRDVFLVLAPKRAGATAARAAHDLQSPSPAPLLADFRFVGEAVPGADSYVRLRTGKILFADVESRRIVASKIATMQVTGSHEDARLPDSRRVLITKHKQLHVPYTLPGESWLHVQNRSSALASFLFIGVASKVTYSALHDAVEHPSLLKLIKLLSLDLVSLSDVGPHTGSYLRFAGSRPGRYLAAVLVFGGGAEPHLHHGQVRILHVI